MNYICRNEAKFQKEVAYEKISSRLINKGIYTVCLENRRTGKFMLMTFDSCSIRCLFYSITVQHYHYLYLRSKPLGTFCFILQSVFALYCTLYSIMSPARYAKVSTVTFISRQNRLRVSP